MSKLNTHNNNQDKLFRPKIYQGTGQVKEEIIIITEVGSKAKIVQVVETDSESPCRVGNNMDKISGEETSEVEERSEKETGDISGTTLDLTGIEVGQGMDSFQEFLKK